MKEFGMNYRKERADGMMVKQLVQFTVILVVCFWFLYHAYHLRHARTEYVWGDDETKVGNERIGKLFGRKGGIRSSSHSAEGVDLFGVEYEIEQKLRTARIGKLLGRRGGLGSSYHAEGMDLYGMDLIGAAERIKHVAEDDEESDAQRKFSEGNDDEEEETSRIDDDSVFELRRLGEFSTKEVNIGGNVQEKKANALARNEDRTLISEKSIDKDEKVEERNKTESKSLVNFGAVILKKDDKKLKVFRFDDENGIRKRDSAPSRRSNIQIQNLLKGKILSSGNPSNVIEACQKLSLHQNDSEKQSLNKSERNAVHEKMKDLTVVKSGKGRMRELLQKEK